MVIFTDLVQQWSQASWCSTPHLQSPVNLWSSMQSKLCVIQESHSSMNRWRWWMSPMRVSVIIFTWKVLKWDWVKQWGITGFWKIFKLRFPSKQKSQKPPMLWSLHLTSLTSVCQRTLSLEATPTNKCRIPSIMR